MSEYSGSFIIDSQTQRVKDSNPIPADTNVLQQDIASHYFATLIWVLGRMQKLLQLAQHCERLGIDNVLIHCIR